MIYLKFAILLIVLTVIIKTKQNVLAWLDDKLPDKSYKARIIDFYKFITDVVLLLLSYVVFIPLSLVGIVYTAFKHLFVKFDYSISKQFGSVVKAITLINDGLANASAGELLNDLIKPAYVKYGKWDQTISAVTGINYVKGDDSKFREDLDDTLGKDHCKNAITDEQKCYYKL